MSALKVSFIASSGMVMIHSTMVVIVVPATGLFFGPVKKNLKRTLADLLITVEAVDELKAWLMARLMAQTEVDGADRS